MTVAMIGALLLLFGSIRVFLWMSERLITRQQGYERTRAAAANDQPGRTWDEPTDRLDILNERR